LALEIRIPQSGVFSYPLIGEVKAAGKTSVDLERDIRARLAKDYLQDPHVTVTVVEYVARKVYILGGIEKPDRYTLLPTEKITLLQLISAAGGFTDRAHKHRVQIVRRTGKAGREVIRLSLADVERALEKGHAEADLELQPDDLVVIPSGARAVYVLGAVKSPGWFDIPTDTRMTVSMAISRAGSYTKFASTGAIQVLRQTVEGESKKFLVDLDEVVNGRLDLDIELEPGDVVWVPERGIF
ncbi:MAG: polysaccharide biosynthesis/export family protein, partial [Planctomycetota bacterium]|nr:polysaccharide biosynthesis/export family protein [Planctomycetota bacterium]